MKNMSVDTLTNIFYPVHVKLECFILTKYKFAYRWPIPNPQTLNNLDKHSSL